MGDNFVAADEVIIEHHTLVGNDVTLGYKTKLEEYVTVEDGVSMGQEVVVKEGRAANFSAGDGVCGGPNPHIPGPPRLGAQQVLSSPAGSVRINRNGAAFEAAP